MRAIFLLLCVLLFLGGCSSMPIPLKSESINPGFENLKSFLEKVEELRKEKVNNPKEMNQEKVFTILGIKTYSPNVARMSRIDIRKLVFEGTEVTGSAEEVNFFTERLAKFSGWRIPYMETNSKGGLGDFGSAVFTQKEGFNMVLTLIFENGVLRDAELEGQESLNEKGKSKLWNSLLSLPGDLARGVILQ